MRASWGVGSVLGAGVRAGSRTGRAGPTGAPQIGSGEASLGGALWTGTEGPGAICVEARGIVSAKALGHWHSLGLRDRNVYFMLSGMTLMRFGVKIYGLKVLTSTVSGNV